MMNITKNFLTIISLIIISQSIFTLGLFASDDLYFQKNVIVVKFTDRAEKSLDIKTVNNKEITGISSVDHLNLEYDAVKVERAFHYAGKFEQRHREFGLHKWYYIKFQENVDVRDFINVYSKDSNIEIAELQLKPVLVGENDSQNIISDLSIKSQLIPNDPLFNQQWHYNSTTDRDIDLPEAWDIQTGDTSVIVSIMDTGADLVHPDLLPNLWVNMDEILNNGIDDDNNGYIDDIHGWNFDENNNDPSDYDDHGTHTAGTVAAATNNQIGVAGVAGGYGNNDGVRLMICRVLGPGGGSTPNAYTYAADNGSVISSNSWTYKYSNNDPAPLPFIVQQAIDYFIANAGSDPGSPMHGGVVVGASANENRDDPYYPAGYNPVIAVSATDQTDAKASFSNYGSWVDISAPGVAVMSTIRNGYDSFQGTSMACPHVSGVLALMASEFPGISNTNARALVEFAVDNIDAQNPNYIGMLGSGRLNAFYALQDAALINGTLTDSSSGFPISNAAIEDMQSGTVFYSDSSGEFNFKLFGVGGHPIQISNFSYKTLVDTITINSPDTLGKIQTMEQNYELQLSPLTLLSVSLMDSVSSDSLRGYIKVYAISNKTNVPEGTMADTTTNMSGNFNILLPANEDYRIFIRPESPFPNKTTEVLNLPVTGTQVDFQFNPAELLLVDDDNGQEYEQFYYDDFQSLSKTFHHWDVAIDGVPTAIDRNNYPDKIMIWFTGDSSSLPLTQAEQNEILDHINNGGKLFLTGQDIAEMNSGTALIDTLGIEFTQNSTLSLILGVAGDEIGNGIVFNVSGFGGSNNQTSKDVIQITDSTISSTIFHYGGGTANPAGIRYQNFANNSKAVFLGFGAEAINDPSRRQTVLSRIVDYLKSPITGIDDNLANYELPIKFELLQNYPNPFNPTTTIEYSVTSKTRVEIYIYNSLGQKIATLLNKEMKTGTFKINWDGTDSNGKRLSSGVYFYHILTESGYSNTKKMLLLK